MESKMTLEAKTPPETGARDVDPVARLAGAWVQQLGRALKTCRLYDAANPTVLKFRDELAIALAELLIEHGPITLRFTTDDILLGDESLYPARSRDDNLALPFHRDGVRALTLSPGIEPREVDQLVDAILQVSGQNFGQDDLVTLLWEARLPHVEVDYVPSEGGSGEVSVEEGEKGIPWPVAQEEDAETEAPAPAETESVEPATGSRSDDWTTGELTVEIEAGFAELDALAPSETVRFRAEFEAEHAVSPMTTALAILRAAFASGANDEDRAELLLITPRLLRQAVGQGAWIEAREALEMLRASGDQAASEAITQELLQPISVATTVEHLDRQEVAAVTEFAEFTRSLGDAGIDLLNAALAESQQRRNRRIFAEAIADSCRDHPERLAPWLADRRWYVVRNIVHILGWIGGPVPLGMLRTASRHPDPRVRYEVTAALGQADPVAARPVLVAMLQGADTRTFCAVLHQLSSARDADVARRVLGYLLDPGFEDRPEEERRSIYATLSAVGGDESVAELEAELLRGNWFARGQEQHRLSVARVLARIGTTAARLALQRGALSKRGTVRRVCEEAWSGVADHG